MEYKSIIKSVFIISILFIFLYSCSKDSPTEPESKTIVMTKVSGDNQVGVMGDTLSVPLVVQLKYSDGEIVFNERVDFRIIEGTGSLSDSIVATDQAGKAKTRLTLGNQVGEVRVEAKAFNSSSKIYFSIDITPFPMIPSVKINDDSTYTTIRNVQLTLSAIGTNLQVKISEDSTFSGVAWEDFNTTKEFILSTGSGTKIVYVKFKDEYGIEQTVSDEIVLDQVSPTSTITSLPDTSFTPDLTIEGTASDELSGVAIVEISLDNGSTWENATGKTSWNYTRSNVTLGQYKIISRAIDNAGNMEITKQPVQLYTIPVSPTLTTITSDFLTILNNGYSTVTITIIPKNYSGVLLGSGLHVVVSATAGTLIGTVADNDDGSYTQQLRSSTSVEMAEITAVVNGVPITNKINVSFIDINIPEIVFVSAGEFNMGDNFNEGRWGETPVHKVYLNAYYIGKYEVTNGQFCAFLNEMGNQSNPGIPQEPWLDINDSDCLIEEIGGVYSSKSGKANHPVVLVSWYGARAYCKWLTDKTGHTYRLPTEAEWEKAARGDTQLNQALGHQRRYPWGDNIDCSYANYYNSGDPFETGNDLKTTPVGYYDGSIQGSFSTNDNSSPYGAYDMAGNVCEWCYDLYSEDYYSISPYNNPTGPYSGYNFCVIRGGSWISYPIFLGSAVRNGSTMYYAQSYIGFRCARVF